MTWLADALVSSRRYVLDGRWIYYTVNREAVARWHDWFKHFFDPRRIREWVVCSPKGNPAPASLRSSNQFSLLSGLLEFLHILIVLTGRGHTNALIKLIGIGSFRFDA